MAGPPPAKPVQIDQAKPPSVISTVAGSKVVSTIRSSTATARRPKFVTEHLRDPVLMTKMLNELVDYVDHATRFVSSSPLLAYNIIEDIVFTAGQTKYLDHGLGRPCTKFIVVASFTADWSGRRVALAAGLTASQSIGIRSTNAGTYSFLVF